MNESLTFREYKKSNGNVVHSISGHLLLKVSVANCH